MKKLMEHLRAAKSPYHCVAYCEGQLTEKGFERIYMDRPFELTRGGNYYMITNGSAIFAFTLGKDFQAGDPVRIIGAHTDYPGVTLKPSCDFAVKGYAQLNTEIYGGPIYSTWMDRPLGLAGRVMLKGKAPFVPESRLFDSENPILIIPNLAIHMNREVNKGVELNAQKDLMPVCNLFTGEAAQEKAFLSYLSEKLSAKPEDILSYDLHAYISEGPCQLGISENMISAQGLDNQASVEAALSAILAEKRSRGINLIAFFDNEEVGSRTRQGAGSLLLRDLVWRIFKNLGFSEEEASQSLYASMALSADAAHALHPNHVSSADPYNQPLMGKGFCIKTSARQTYVCDSEAIAVVKAICQEKTIPYQVFTNRSDMRGGSTIGNIMAASLPIKAVDIGVPILAMHSARELMAMEDQESLRQLMKAFFSI